MTLANPTKKTIRSLEHTRNNKLTDNNGLQKLDIYFQNCMGKFNRVLLICLVLWLLAASGSCKQIQNMPITESQLYSPQQSAYNNQHIPQQPQTTPPPTSQPSQLPPTLTQTFQLDQNTTNLQKILESLYNSPNLYSGYFNSKQVQPTLDYITENTGEIYMGVYTYQTPQDQLYVENGEIQMEKTREMYLRRNRKEKYNVLNPVLTAKRSQNNRISVLQSIKRSHKQFIVRNNSQLLLQNPSQQQPTNNYSIALTLLNPQYVTQQTLDLVLNIFPGQFNVPKNQSSTQQTCTTLSPYEWQCNNTQMNYTRNWREYPVDKNERLSVKVNYYMRFIYEDGGDGINADTVSVQFGIVKVTNQFEQYQGQDEYSTIFGSDPQIDLQITTPLTRYETLYKLIPYVAFLMTTLIIQLASAHFVVNKLNNNHVMANKLSLVTLCFCTIYDLSNMISFVYRIIGAITVFKRILYILPAIAFGVLYFFYDIQLLTRILITKYNHRVEQAPGNNNTLSKILIGFYLVLFLSYEGFVLLFAFFEFQWWLILLTSSFILIPQIIHNIRIGNGGNHGFTVAFLLGFLASRWLIFFYQHGCPANYPKIKPFAWISITLLVLLVVQLVILYCQSKFGARFFIPNALRGDYYNYSHKVKLQELYIDRQQKIQCNICLQDLIPDQYIQQLEQKTSNNISEPLILSSKVKDQKIEIYKTPCNHMFHEDCLKNWMQVKLECPTCRSGLPVI